MKLNADQLRKSGVGESKKLQHQVKRNQVVLVLDNVFDTYNIGCFFRLADALAAQKLYLCGPIVTPPNIKIHRSSIGTWKWVPWQHFPNTTDCLVQLKKEGFNLIACEQAKTSVDYRQANYQKPLAIVLGSESAGIDPKVQKLVDQIVEIPLYGINKSLNVLVAASVISFAALDSSK